MTRMVQCIYLKKEAEGMDYAPYPGELGKRIYNEVSKEAWQLWLKHQTMLVNENRLNLADQRARQLNELWDKRMNAVGLRMRFEAAPFGELIKRALAGQLQMWGYSWSNGPDGDFFLGLAYGPNADQSNDARFKLPAFDRLYEKQTVMPNGPERLAVMREAQKLMLAYVPYIAHVHPIDTDLSHAPVRHLIRHPFKATWWHFTDLAAAPPA